MSHPFQTAISRLNKDLIDLAQIPNVRVDLRYNGTNNFMSTDLYRGFNKAYLHEIAFYKLQRCCLEIQKAKPEYKVLVLDALRPRSVQTLMYAHVQETPWKNYVADPRLGSLHNFGMAIDLTLLDSSGHELDMGTGFDDFSVRAQPQLELELVKAGELTELQIQNRLLLRGWMESAGFQQLPHEWWHYNALPAADVRGHFEIVE
jgi:D-alanyl-D-alanine dipeptidase